MRFDELDLYKVGHTIQIVGVIYAGEGKTLLCYLPGDRENLPAEELEMTISEWERFVQQTDLVEVECLAKAENGDLVKVLLRKSARQVTQGVNWAVFKRDHYRCRYCGKQGGENGLVLTVDHLVLWEHMGPSIEANLLTACKKCNKVRGNILYEDWLRHPYYRDVSKGLPPAIIEANKAVAATLKSIPLRQVEGSRR